MKVRVYKKFLCIVLLAASHSLIAQKQPSIPPPVPPIDPVRTKELDFKLKDLDVSMKELNIKLKDLNHKLNKELDLKLTDNLKTLSALKDVSKLNLKLGSDFEKDEKDFNRHNIVEKIKKVTKTYSVSSKDKLSINNQYGKVLIHVWPKNEIKVEVEIRAYEASESAAQKLLDGVSIDESKDADLISFRTNIDRSSNVKGIGSIINGKEDRRGVSIDYVVYMPGRNPLDIINKFGGVTLKDFDGPVNIKNSYGSVLAADLQNSSNVIDVKYGSATIEKLKGSNISVSYGSLKVSNANQINADVRYGSTKIGKLSNGGNFENKYGSIKIEELSGKPEALVITADKGSVTMGLKASSNFDFDVTVNMGGFQYPDDKVNITSKTADGARPVFVKNYKGEFGKGSESRVQIKCNYGSVKFE